MAGNKGNMTALELLDFLNDESIPDEAPVYAKTGNIVLLLNTAKIKNGKVWLSLEMMF
jgi:hypothetical protein